MHGVDNFKTDIFIEDFLDLPQPLQTNAIIVRTMLNYTTISLFQLSSIQC